MMDDLISRQAAIDSLKEERCPCESDYDEGYLSMLDKAIWIMQEWLPSAQPEPDWDYSKETKQITLIVPEDVYDSAETIFLSVGYEGTFGIRGMVYSVQPEQCSDCIVHGGDWECDHMHC